jgi:FAD/FMN-containing dehydrogenase
MLQPFPSKVAETFTYEIASWYSLSKNVVPNHEGMMVRVYNGFLCAEENKLDNWQEIIAVLWEACSGSEHCLAAFEFRGGAVTDVPPDQTAFFWREGIFNIRLVLMVPASATDSRRIFEAGIRNFDHHWKRIEKYLTGTYTNYAEASLGRDEYAKVTWGDNLDRLVEIKQRYDPDNVFHHPQSVPLPSKDME